MSELKQILVDISNIVPEEEKKIPKWERGYNADYDIVVISYTKRIGQIVEIDGLKIALPEVPPKKEILFSNIKDPNDQLWERTPLPDDLSEIEEEASEQDSVKLKLTAEEIFYSKGEDFVSKHIPYINEEFRRREEGIWFMNNGEPVYITGRNYMFIQWSYLQHSYYPKYRWTQRVLWLHWEACVADRRSFGQCYLKNRRSGYSTMNMADNVDFATKNKSVLVGIISKTGDDAQEMFMEMVTPVFNSYPFFFKPAQDGTTNPRKELAFRKISERITAKNRGGSKKSGGLNSKIRWWPTKKNSMDSKEINKQSIDEAGKFPADVPVDQYWPIARKCLLKGVRKVGKSMVGSTANAPEEGGKEFKNLYEDSKEETRSKITGETTSGLNSLFIPAQYNLEGCFDRFGNPILYDTEEGVVNEFGKKVYIGSISILKEKEAQLKNNPEALNQQRRLDPTTEADAFLTPADNCLFDQDKIETQKEYNGSKYNHTTKLSKLYRRGDLIWIEKYKNVKWVDNPIRGKFLSTYLPDRTISNNIGESNGAIVPLNGQYFVGGIDSYDISGTVDGRGSNGSLHIYAKNAFMYAPNQFVLEYCDRPADANIFYDNCLKALIYYGCPALIENNKPRLLHIMKEKGFRKFSMNRPDKKFRELSPTERAYGGVPSSAGTIDTQAECVESYVLRHVGVNGVAEFGEVGKMGNCYFDDLLDDWLKFDINNRTKFDRTVSSSLALWGAQRISAKQHEINKKRYKYFRK